MDIYEYLNSIDEEKYLRDIKYEFSPIEKAWIINHSQKITIVQKHKAFNKLIKESKDTEIPSRRMCKHFDSLHKFLKEYMEIENKLLDIFASNLDAVYTNSYYYYDEDSDLYDSVELDTAYSRVDIATNKLHDEYFYKTSERRTIRKHYLNDSKRMLSIDFSYKDEPLRVYGYGILTEKEKDVFYAFDGMWFSVPTPFKLGDIVRNSTNFGHGFLKGDFVLTDIITNNSNKFIIENGDSVDMTAWGFFVNEDGSVYHEGMDNYIDLEYSNPSEMILDYISKYLKKEMNMYDLLDKYRSYISKKDINKQKAIFDRLHEQLEEYYSV